MRQKMQIPFSFCAFRPFRVTSHGEARRGCMRVIHPSASTKKVVQVRYALRCITLKSGEKLS